MAAGSLAEDPMSQPGLSQRTLRCVSVKEPVLPVISNTNQTMQAV